MMPELARLSFEIEGGVELARVGGEVDASNVAALTRQILDSVSNETRALVLDLTNTNYMDSSGISLIFDTAARMKNRQLQLRLVVQPRSFVDEVLAAVSMQDSVPIDPAMADALSAVGSSASP
jgi:anti-sigma B factor antagonist